MLDGLGDNNNAHIFLNLILLVNSFIAGFGPSLSELYATRKDSHFKITRFLTTQVVAGFCALVMKLQHVCYEITTCSGPLRILSRFQRDHFAKSLPPMQNDSSLGRICEMCPPKRFWLCALRDVLGIFSSR